MHAFSYRRDHDPAVTHKDGGQITGSAVSENPMSHTNLQNQSYGRWKFTLREYEFSNVFAPVTLTLTR